MLQFGYKRGAYVTRMTAARQARSMLECAPSLRHRRAKRKAAPMKIRVHVSLKPGVLDPQGEKLLANTVIENFRIEKVA